MNPLLVIDCDPAVYQAAFSAQRSVYHTVHETKSGELKQRIWTDGNKMLAFFRRFKGCTLLDKEKIIEPEPADHARQAAATIIKRTINAVAKELQTSAEEMDIEVYLSGPNNFRVGLATITPYKATRSDPPIHYNVVRNYFVDHWNAIVVHNWEADDQVAFRCRQAKADGRPVVMATIDKDLDQVAVKHYDYRQHVFYDIDETYAELFFLEQVLAGDATDTIQGIPKLGPKGARTLVAQWAEEWEGEVDGNWDRAVWGAIVGEYMKAMDKYPDRFPEVMTPEEAALENARLVKMLDYPGQLWTPPGVPDEEIPT